MTKFRKLLTEVFWRRAKGSSGFTLASVLVSVSIISLAFGFVGSGVFNVLSIDWTWREDVAATRDLRKAGMWLSTDAFSAQTTSLTDGGVPTDALTLTWTDKDKVVHQVDYSLSGGKLLRSRSGQQIELARSVVSVEFSLSGSLLTMDLEVDSGGSSTDSLRYQSFLRRLGT